MKNVEGIHIWSQILNKAINLDKLSSRICREQFRFKFPQGEICLLELLMLLVHILFNKLILLNALN